MTIRYHLNTLFLLVLLGAATAADARSNQSSPSATSRKPRSSASETRAGCGVCRSVVRW